MGQIKNIKLHIVTDIKESIIKVQVRTVCLTIVAIGNIVGVPTTAMDVVDAVIQDLAHLFNPVVSKENQIDAVTRGHARPINHAHQLGLGHQFGLRRQW